MRDSERAQRWLEDASFIRRRLFLLAIAVVGAIDHVLPGDT